METETLILKDNSPEIRKALTDSGIECCVCCNFGGALWLDYKHSVTNEVHGVGYWAEDSAQKEVVRFEKECKNPYICSNVEEFILKIKEQQKQ